MARQKKGNRETKPQRKQKKKIVNLCPNLSIIILNVSDLNTPIKRYRLAEQILKPDLILYYLKETNFT